MIYEILLSMSLYQNPNPDGSYFTQSKDSLNNKVVFNDDTVNVDSLSKLKYQSYARMGIILDGCDNCGFWDQAIVDKGKSTERMVYEIEVPENGIYSTLRSLNYSLERDGFKTINLEQLIEHNKNILPKDLRKIPKGTKIHWSGEQRILFDIIR